MEKEKTKTAFLLIIVLILALGIGIGVGILLAKKLDKATGENKQENTANTLVSNNTIDEKNTVSEEEMYESVINEYKNAASEYDENEIDTYEKIENKYSMINSMIVFMIKRYPEGNSKIAYTYYDIDGNGIKELIVGIKYDSGFSEGAIYSYNLAFKRPEIVFIQDTMERGSLHIYDNGIIFSEGSGGAALHYYGFGKIGENGYSFEEIEEIEEEYTQESSTPVYRDYKANKVLGYKSLDEITAKYLNNSDEVKFSNLIEIEL